MAVPVNGARGEVALTIGDTELVIAASMEGLAAVSSHLGCKSMAEMFARLSYVEVAAAMAAIRFLTVRGDSDAAMKALNLSHFDAIADAVTLALSHHFKDRPGNAVAAGTTE